MGLKKELKKVLDFISKKLAKKQKKKAKKAKKAKRAKVSLAEYAKNKMLLDMQSKMASGGSGAPLTKLTANLDTESMKRDMQELKEKNKDQQKEYVKVANDLSRAVSGIEQYKQQLQLEHEQHRNPREEWGTMMLIEQLPEVVELKNAVLLLQNAQNEAMVEKQIAVDEGDEAKIEELAEKEEEIVVELVKQEKQLEKARKKGKQQTEAQFLKQQERDFMQAKRDAAYSPSGTDAPVKSGRVAKLNPVGRPINTPTEFLGDRMNRAASAASLADSVGKLAKNETGSILGSI